MTGGGDAADAEGAAPDSEDERWLTRGVGGSGLRACSRTSATRYALRVLRGSGKSTGNTLNVDGGVPAAYTR